MTGFPNRPARLAFGPNMRNKRPPAIADKDLSANQVNLNFWQTAGSGRTTPMAVFLYDGAGDGGLGKMLFQAFAFDPNQLIQLGDFDVVKNGTGDYTFTFATNYPDETGNPIPFVPRMSQSQVQNGGTTEFASSFLPIGQSIQVQVRNTSDTLVDRTIMLAVW